MNKLILCAMALVLASTVNALDIQKDQNAEKQNVLAESNGTPEFAQWLFSGAFTKQGFSGVNPEYRINQGDTLLVQLWGGLDYQQETQVDAQGNIFIPKVGPVKVLGVENKNLNNVVLKSIKRVYKANVQTYVTLLSSQTVKVFLSGMVNNPGLYEGQSADSVLAFIDKAGGIRKHMGSYRNISVKRNGKTVKEIDLYAFIQQGTMPSVQLHEGDVIFVAPKTGDITIEGEVGFAGKYELKDKQANLNEILAAVAINENATHVTLVQPFNKNGMKEVSAKQFGLTELNNVNIQAGSTVKVSSQLRANSISVEVVGEHNSQYEMVLPWGATLKDLLDKVEFTNLSNQTAIQLYRKSVAKRQKDMLMASLSSLEQSVLTARSATNETAQLRKAEAEIILQWIDKAKDVQPKGLGHAIACAKPLVGDNPFVVILPDVIIDDVACDLSKDNLADMLNRFRATGRSQVMVEAVADDQVDKYGIADCNGANINPGDSVSMIGMVEKPALNAAPSNLAVVGRYVLPASIWSILENTPAGAGGEVQLTDAIATLMQSETVEAYSMIGKSHDCGSKFGYMKANIEYSLRHPEIGSDIKKMLLNQSLSAEV